ncbi:tyrosine-type recombinase/integrase [Streptomyces sp. NPDC059224]|uniref:tyrosine-type recombinase/integrase n=1 Tax=Streptomyces sp. NPDC059224 TaxID=3346775 RepID=UPI0036970FE7
MAKFPPADGDARKPRRDCIGSWQARYRDADGEQKARNFPKKKEAEAFLDDVRGSVRKGTYLDPKRGDITLEKWWDEWWPANTPSRPTTRNRKYSAWTHHIRPKWGRRKLNSLTYLELQTWVAKELKGHATQTKVLELLKALLRDAVRDQRIPFSPAVDVTKTSSPPVKHPDDIAPPTTEQYALIREQLPSWWHPIADFLEETGLRWGEMAGTRRVFFDLDDDTVKVREVVIDDRGTLRRQGIPKTAAGFRTVPLSPKARTAVDIMIARLDPAATVTAVEDGMHAEELMFRSPLGGEQRKVDGKLVTVEGALNRNNFRRYWIPAIKSAGLARMVTNPETGRKEWWPRVSDYRDRFASRLHEGGMSEVDVQYILGHERGGKVTWMYTHRGEQALENARAALSEGRHLRAVS